MPQANIPWEESQANTPTGGAQVSAQISAQVSPRADAQPEAKQQSARRAGTAGMQGDAWNGQEEQAAGACVCFGVVYLCVVVQCT